MHWRLPNSVGEEDCIDCLSVLGGERSATCREKRTLQKIRAGSSSRLAGHPQSLVRIVIQVVSEVA
jgi:hypothetical protein